MPVQSPSAILHAASGPITPPWPPHRSLDHIFAPSPSTPSLASEIKCCVERLRPPNKIGHIKDVLVDQSGKIDTLIVGVGGFLGLTGGKHVAIPFEEVRTTKKDNKVHLVMNVTRSFRKSTDIKYDNNTTTWVPDNSRQTSEIARID